MGNTLSEVLPYPLTASDSALRPSPAPTRRPHIYLPPSIPPDPHFLGRGAILDALDALLLPDPDREVHSGLRVFALSGPPGVGKTAIAREYVVSRGEKFDVVVWLSGDTGQKLGAGVVEMSRALGLECKEEGYRDEGRSKEVVREWMAWGGGEESEEVNLLVVIDGVDDMDVLKGFWPREGGAKGAVILTSRDARVGDVPVGIASVVEVQPLSVEEGGELFWSLVLGTQSTQSRASCEKMSRSVGGLPLSIRLMAGIVCGGHNLSVRLKKSYHDAAEGLLGKEIPREGLMWKLVVVTSCAIDVLSPPAAALLRALSFLDPDRVQEEVLLKGASKCGIENYPEEQVGYCEARDELIGMSLITFNAVTGDLRIHRLIQTVVRNSLDHSEGRSVFNGAIKLISAVWPFTEFRNRNKPARWPIYSTYMPHTTHVREIAQRNLHSMFYYVNVDAAILFDDAAWYMCEKAANEEIVPYAKATRAALRAFHTKSEGVLDSRRIEELREASKLTMAIAAQGRGDGPEALHHAKRAWCRVLTRVDPMKKHYSRDSMSLAVVYTNLGIGYSMTGEVEQSLRLWRLARKEFRKCWTFEMLDLTWPAVSMSLVCSRRGEHERAAKVLVPVYNALVRMTEEEQKASSKTGAILRAMGHLRIAQGMFAGGLRFHERALRNLRMTLGKTHPQTADCMYNVAEDLLRFQRVAEASKLIDEALVAWGDNPWYCPTAARALWRKGRILRASGKRLEAEKYLQKAMQIHKILDQGDERDEEELVEEDWTRLIFYYSK